MGLGVEENQSMEQHLMVRILILYQLLICSVLCQLSHVANLTTCGHDIAVLITLKHHNGYYIIELVNMS